MTEQEIINLLKSRINQACISSGVYSNDYAGRLLITLSVDEARAIINQLSKKNQAKFMNWSTTEGGFI